MIPKIIKESKKKKKGFFLVFIMKFSNYDINNYEIDYQIAEAIRDIYEDTKNDSFEKIIIDYFKKEYPKESKLVFK
jgi:hypothetical protein